MRLITNLASTFLFVILFISCIKITAQVPNLGLVSYYPLDGNANDSGIFGFNGVLGGQTMDVGVCGSAYQFNNNSIDCGNHSQFDLVNDATVSLWVKLKSLPSSYYTLIGKDVSAGNNQKKWFIAIHNNKVSFHINGAGMGNGYWIYSNSFIFQVDVYYHIVITKSGNNYKFYINCNLNALQTLPLNVVANTAPLRIGKNENSQISAVIDEVFIYDRVLTQQEVNRQCVGCSSLTGSSISGIINSYSKVTSIDPCNSLSVQDASAFSIGDRVLLIQMKGATIDLSNTPGFGNILNYNNAGNYEFSTISKINGNRITFLNTLLRNYSASSDVQLIRVPKYQGVEVADTLTCLPWNGTVGGVLVLEVSGTLSINADIDVSGKGFRGGNVSVNSTQPNTVCTLSDYFYSSGSFLSGQKGESIAESVSIYDAGRGRNANGGGGGNQHNAGGAGGGNGGAGGRGGDEWSGCSIQSIGGDGGFGLNYSNTLNKIFLGGGGGGGHQNDNQGTSGVSGGGIIIIKADTIKSNGFKIRSNGVSQSQIAGNDAAGGGGAGGTVLLVISNSISITNVDCHGGNGGDNDRSWGTLTECWGPGGGGGGGVVWSNGSPLSLNISIDGGLNGSNYYNFCNDSIYGSEAGSNGISLTGLLLQESNILNVPDSIYISSSTCNLSDTGILIQNLINVHGCDSVVITKINNYPEYSDTTINTIQFGEIVNTVPVYSDTIFVTKFTTSHGCDSDFVEIVKIVESGAFIPNTFTPNDDDINDVFKVFGFKISKVKILIFNRWGEVIFDREDNSGWNGTYKDQFVEEGVYTYKISVEFDSGEIQEHKGRINVVK